MRNILLFTFFLGVTVGCSSKEVPYQVIINTNRQCSFDYDDENFCEDDYQKIFNKFPKEINFDKDKTIVFPEKNELGRVYVINNHSRIVYPLGYDIQWSDIDYNKDSNHFCFVGFITAYRSEHTGDFCFIFNHEGNFDLKINNKTN